MNIWKTGNFTDRHFLMGYLESASIRPPLRFQFVFALWLLLFLMQAQIVYCGDSTIGSKSVALLGDTTYVDYNPAVSVSEASGLEAGIRKLGAEVDVFTMGEPGGVEYAVYRRDALVIPELETSSSFLDTLDEATREIIRSYVKNGGSMLVHGDLGQRSLALLNGLFGFSLAAGSDTGPYTLDETASFGTPYASGPASLPSNSATRPVSLASLPYGARPIYFNGDNVAMFIVKMGRGWVVFHAWDWYNAAPAGAMDNEWTDILRAFFYLEPDSKTVALLGDVTYVDYRPGETGGEASNLEEGITGLGGEVTVFSLTDSGVLAGAISGRDALVIPDLEKSAGLYDDLNETERNAIRSFVNEGGMMLVHGDSGQRSLALLNGLFGFSIVTAATQTSYSQGEAASFSTSYSVGPGSLPNNSASNTVSNASLPFGAQVVYANGDSVAVFIVPVGKGWVAFHAWDWFNAVPVGTVDNGWIIMLKAFLKLEPLSGAVALLADNTYVEYNQNYMGAEASNMEACLKGLGKNVDAFTLSDPGGIDGALSGAEAFVVPDLERSANLFDDLDETSRDAVRNYVRSGGLMLVHGDGGSRSLTLLNGLFGYSLTAGTSGLDTVFDEAASFGTSYASGPATLPANNSCRTVSLASLPFSAQVVYAQDDTVTVVIIPEGKGWIAFHAWDWFDAVPNGIQDNGWIGLLKAFLNLESATGSVAMLADSVYVDYNPGNEQAEASNMEASLKNLGKEVEPFILADLSGMAEMLENKDALVVPDLEEYTSFIGDLDESSREDIRHYVEEGGLMLVHGDAGGRSLALLNALFGYSLSAGTSEITSTLDEEASFGTPYASGPVTLPANNSCRTASLASLPVNARAIYHNDTSVTIFAIPVMKGWVVFHAWDWYSAVPVGSLDNGWMGMLAAFLKLSPPAKSMALLADTGYVDYIPE